MTLVQGRQPLHTKAGLIGEIGEYGMHVCVTVLNIKSLQIRV